MNQPIKGSDPHTDRLIGNKSCKETVIRPEIFSGNRHLLAHLHFFHARPAEERVGTQRHCRRDRLISKNILRNSDKTIRFARLQIRQQHLMRLAQLGIGDAFARRLAFAIYHGGVGDPLGFPGNPRGQKNTLLDLLYPKFRDLRRSGNSDQLFGLGKIGQLRLGSQYFLVKPFRLENELLACQGRRYGEPILPVLPRRVPSQPLHLTLSLFGTLHPLRPG